MTCRVLCFGIILGTVVTGSFSCSSSEFECDNGDCIPLTWSCDGQGDCPDKSDEDNCKGFLSCGSSEFKCGDGDCIPSNWLCDGQYDCPDKSDEDSCKDPKTCAEDEYTCADNQCIPQQWKCDGDPDCTDSSDEKDCGDLKCKGQSFYCDGKCLPKVKRCDGYSDCSDSSDERNCRCSKIEFQCLDGDCIHRSWVCDGDNDCNDKSDELNCTQSNGNQCQGTQFMCASDLTCISEESRCNGVVDCGDASDEQDCGCSETQFHCESNECISIISKCNGVSDCTDGSDEINCKPVCPEGDSNCEPDCRVVDGNITCECGQGYELFHAGLSCSDVDECKEANTGLCSQVCHNTIGSYECSCLEGYTQNGSFCFATGEEAKIIFSNRFDVREISASGKNYRLIAEAHTVALDFDVEEGELFYTHLPDDLLCQQPITSANISEAICNGEANGAMTIDGMAYDWIHRNIYWSDTGLNTISVMALGTDNHYLKTLISDALDEPRAVVVDPRDGQKWLYWTDWGTDPKIERSGLDGSNRQKLVDQQKTNIQWPNGLTLDFTINRLFWADGKFGSISSANLDGGDIRIVIISHSSTRFPFGLDVFEDWLFWTDWKRRGIYKVNKYDGTGEEAVLFNLAPMGIRIHHKVRQPRATNPCGANNGGCAQLCLPSPVVSGSKAGYICAFDDNTALTTTSSEVATEATQPDPNVSYQSTTKSPCSVKGEVSTEGLQSKPYATTEDPDLATNGPQSTPDGFNDTVVVTLLPETEEADIAGIAGVILGVVGVVTIVSIIGTFL